MSYNNKNIKLINKLEKWNKNPHSFDLERYLLDNIKNGLEYCEVLADFYINTDRPEKVLEVFVKYLKKDKGTVKCIEHICDIINSTTPDTENILGLLLLLNELKEDDPKVLSMIIGVYQEYGWTDRIVEIIGELPEDSDINYKVDYYTKLLYSEIDEYIEKAKPFFNSIDIKSFSKEMWISLGSAKFYSGQVKEGLLYHFGGEDFRPQEFTSSYKPISIEEDFNNKSIIITTYRGMGDSMILSRFLPKFIEKYPQSKITICTEKPLVPLYENIRGVDFVGTSEDCSGILYDTCLGVNHLAHFIRDNLVDTEDKCIYHEWINYPSSYDDKWLKELKISGPIVGINWKGSMSLGGTGRSSRNTSRDIELIEFIPIVEQYSNYTFVCLNPDISDEELTILNKYTNVVIPSKIKDFADTAAIINMCDIVVSTDTSIATLCASLSKDIIIMAKFWPDYRWLYFNKWWDLSRLNITVHRKYSKSASWTTVIFNVIKSLSYLEHKCLKN